VANIVELYEAFVEVISLVVDCLQNTGFHFAIPNDAGISL
jgi:hypothetical protein